MSQQDQKERRRTARIPVDAVLLYRAVGMEDYEICHVLNVSTLSLEILLDQALGEGTVVTIAVRPEGSSQQYYRVMGEVKRTFDPAPNPVEAYETACRKGHYSELKECRADLDAWEASILPNRPVAAEQGRAQVSSFTV